MRSARGEASTSTLLLHFARLSTHHPVTHCKPSSIALLDLRGRPTMHCIGFAIASRTYTDLPAKAPGLDIMHHAISFPKYPQATSCSGTKYNNLARRRCPVPVLGTQYSVLSTFTPMTRTRHAEPNILAVCMLGILRCLHTVRPTRPRPARDPSMVHRSTRTVGKIGQA